MEKLATEFNMSFPEEKRNNKESRIRIAGTILAGIAVRNMQRENGNLNGKMEESPYTLKQEKMIYRYTSLENTQEIIDNYEEANFSEKEREYYQEL